MQTRSRSDRVRNGAKLAVDPLILRAARNGNTSQSERDLSAVHIATAIGFEAGPRLVVGHSGNTAAFIDQMREQILGLLADLRRGPDQELFVDQAIDGPSSVGELRELRLATQMALEVRSLEDDSVHACQRRLGEGRGQK
jgi:hypothetical protein